MTTETALRPYDVRDPARLIEAIASAVPLSAGSVHLALVEHPATTQRLVRVEPLRSRPEWHSFGDAREELRTVVNAWPLPRERVPPAHTAVFVVARPGFCVIGPGEAAWLHAWSYANFLRPIYAAELILVTEHGWTDYTTHFAGFTPALAPDRV